MERVTVVVEIVGGKTVFREVVEELPLFAQTGDLTETLGQYPCAITRNSKKIKKEKSKSKEKLPLYSVDSIMYG
jgi:hypothetical protein